MARGWMLLGRGGGPVAPARADWTRRRALRAALLATGATSAGALIAAYGTAARRASSGPTAAAAAPVVLTVLPAQAWPTAIGPTLWELLYAGLAPFFEANPGVDVRLFTDQGYQGATQAAMLAGAGPDVFSDWILPPFIQNDLMLNIRPWVERDRLNLNAFPPGETSFFQEAAALFSSSAPSGIFAVPAYVHTEAYAVNLTTVDAAGQKRPQPDWTVDDWQRLWEGVTVRPRRGRRQRFGTDLDNAGYDYSYNMISPYRLWGYGGEYVDPADPTRCFLTSPGSLACGRARYQLLWDGVAGYGDFGQGTVVCTHNTCTCGSQVIEAERWKGFQWDYFQDPAWPRRRSAYAASDFYGIWAGTPHAEQAWALLKWMAFGPDWQRLVMRTSLAGPNQARLWEEWKRAVVQFAPPLRDKNLDAFVQPVLHGEPYFGRVFRYAEAEVKAIIARYAQLLDAKRIQVDAAFHEMAQQIDDAQKAAAGTARAQAGARRRFAGDVASALAAEDAGHRVTFPKPPTDGMGTPPVPAPTLAWRNRRSGTVTVVGEGGGIAGASDSMTFAAQAFVAGSGSFICRLSSISARSGKRLADGAKIGLMARSDLSSMAGEVGIEVAMGRGVHMHTRPFPGTSLGDHRPPSATQPTGLIGQDVILRDDAKPAHNYLLGPIWLRLDFTVDRWTAYTSLDGSRWTAAFAPVGMGFLGCWVGVFATPRGGNDVLAIFDHLRGFQPDTFVTVGVS